MKATSTIKNFSDFEVLTTNQMLQVRGGKDKGDTRDRDIFDFGEEKSESNDRD
jgi:hypothetical protein